MNIETALNWMAVRQGRVTYSMDYRNGPNSYDCSSSVYYALTSAGMPSASWALNTEYMHDWLTKNGWTLIAENHGWDAERGDIFIWGQRNFSSGSGGHTGMFVDADNIIHCNYGYNSITVNNHDVIWEANGCPYVYAYRYTGHQTIPQAKPAIQDEFERQLDANTPLSNRDMPYYEAALSEDYYVETKPWASSPDKELLKAGTRVRVYEKQNGWARINHPQSDQWVEDSYLVDANKV